MFKRIPDDRLNQVSGAVGNKPTCNCKCICVEMCACDGMIPGDDAASYAVMVPQSTTYMDTSSTASADWRPNH